MALSVCSKSLQREALIKAHLMNKNITRNLIFYITLYKISFKENAALGHIIQVCSNLYASTYFI